MLALQAPSADARDIKRAYHAMMREFHPDRWAASGVDTSDMCMLLNEIYEVSRTLGLCQLNAFVDLGILCMSTWTW